MARVSIAGLDKAAVLAALYNNARPFGMGRFQARQEVMTVEQARELIDSGANPDYPGERRGIYFDYLYGRPLKIDLDGDEVSTALYDRDQGEGKGERVINGLRETASATTGSERQRSA